MWDSVQNQQPLVLMLNVQTFAVFIPMEEA